MSTYTVSLAVICTAVGLFAWFVDPRLFASGAADPTLAQQAVFLQIGAIAALLNHRLFLWYWRRKGRANPSRVHDYHEIQLFLGFLACVVTISQFCEGLRSPWVIGALLAGLYGVVTSFRGYAASARLRAAAKRRTPASPDGDPACNATEQSHDTPTHGRD